MRWFIAFTLLLITPSLITCQELNFPYFDFSQESTELNPYYDQLKVKDKEALIVKIHTSNYWEKRPTFHFVVYNTNGKVKLLRASLNKQGKLKVKRKKLLNTSKSMAYHLLLDSTLHPILLLIDPSRLNINSKPIDDQRSKVLHISDGTSYHLQIIQGKQFTRFSTHEPYTFIEKKFTGYEHRQRMMEIIEKYYKLIKSE